jgi:hypothetical protein
MKGVSPGAFGGPRVGIVWGQCGLLQVLEGLIIVGQRLRQFHLQLKTAGVALLPFDLFANIYHRPLFFWTPSIGFFIALFAFIFWYLGFPKVLKRLGLQFVTGFCLWEKGCFSEKVSSQVPSTAGNLFHCRYRFLAGKSTADEVEQKVRREV